jgi:hypothetical protein
VLWVILLALAGPAETLSGKFVPGPEIPLPEPLPDDVAALCNLVEGGHREPRVYAALGDALLASGRPALAYRAFSKAHRLRPDDRAWGEAMTAGKAAATHVPDAVIAEEEREAEAWTAALAAYRKEAADPDDLGPFYERFGPPGADMARHVRARRISGAAGIAGVLIGVAFLVGGRMWPRRAAVLPALVGAFCAAGPALTGQRGLFAWGAGFAFAGAVVTALAGRRRAARSAA